MGKRLILSVTASVAMSFGGWLVSCGGGSSASDSAVPVIVQLPDHCTLISPVDTLGAMSSGVPVVQVKPGKVHFTIDDNGRTIEIDRDITSDQHQIKFTQEDLN